MKRERAALLMALDAAVISVEEVLRDRGIRRKALDAMKPISANSSRKIGSGKAEANDEIQSEMGRLTSQYLERIKRNLDEVTLEISRARSMASHKSRRGPKRIPKPWPYARKEIARRNPTNRRPRPKERRGAHHPNAANQPLIAANDPD